MIIHAIILFLLLSSPSILSSQEETNVLPGGTLFNPGVETDFSNTPKASPDTQLYMPETFERIDAQPPSQEKGSYPIEKPQKKRSVFRFGMDFSASYGQFEKLPFSDLYFSPYISAPHFILLYEVPLRFNWQGTFIKEMWTSSAAAVSKIYLDLYFSSTNHLVKDAQISITPNQSIVQGHGRFFYDYNPNIYTPYQPIKTLTLNLDLTYAGFNYILANIAQPDLMGAEFYIRPLAWLKNPKLNIYRNFKIYGMYAVDLDPYQSYQKNLYEFPVNPNSPALTMFEIGMDLPIFSVHNKFDFSLYADYSGILPSSKDNLQVRSGQGISFGFVMDFLEIMPFRFELNKAIGYWQPRWVNEFYYIDRPYIANNGIIQKPNKILTTLPNLTYYTASFGLAWKEKGIFANIEVFGDTGLNDLWLTISLILEPKLVPLFSARFNWTQRQLLNGISYNPNNTILDITLNYHMLPNMTWSLIWKMTGIINENSTYNNSSSFQILGLSFAYRL